MNQNLITTELFKPSVAHILRRLILAPEKAWYLSELAREIGVPVSSIQREVASLTKSEVIKSHRDGNRVYFQANQSASYFVDLQRLLLKTGGLAGLLARSFSDIEMDLDCGFIFGSFATGRHSKDSDLDLFFIGSASLTEILRVLRPISMKLGIEANPVVMSKPEFRDMLTSQNHFLSAVVAESKIFFIGNENDLARLTR